MSTGRTRGKQKQTPTRSSLGWIALATFLVPVAAILILALALPGQSLLDNHQGSGWSTSRPEEQGMNPGKLEAYLAGLAETGAEPAPGESVESEKDGHSMVLQISDLALEGGTLPSVSGAWICDRANRAFAVTYLTTAEMTSTELQATFERYLEGLSCQ